MTFAKAAIARLGRKHKSASSDRIAGLGIASPFHQLQSQDESGIPAAWLASWQEVDIRAELDRLFDWPVYLFNDAMVAAGAELMFGSGLGRADFLYAYIGHFDRRRPGARSPLVSRAVTTWPARLAACRSPPPARAVERCPSSAQARCARWLVNSEGENAHRIWSSPEDWGDLGERADRVDR